jgi:hypothetical protein
MTKRHMVNLLVTGVAVALTASVLLRRRLSQGRPGEQQAHSIHGSSSVPVVGARALDSLMTVLVQKAPFRWSRRALGTANPSGGGPGMTAPGGGTSAPPKPTLLLAGIVWGRQPLAVLEGVPGTSEPRVVVEGDTAGGLRVRSVTRDRVVVTGFDTVWTLQLKARWP